MENNEKLISTYEKNVLTLTINNIQKKNSLSLKVHELLREQLNKAKTDDNVHVIYLTSNGDFFSSGNDFNNFVEQTNKDQSILFFEEFVNYLITYPKVLIAGVNGPAIGIAFTMLALFDIVLCSDRSIFTVPFVQTGQTPEACSSFLFPLLLGKSTAGNLLLNGGVLNAVDAKNIGFVANVYESDYFKDNAYDYVLKVGKHPLKNLIKIKSIINKNFSNVLKEVNNFECVELRKCWDQEEFQDVIKRFVKKPKF